MKAKNVDKQFDHLFDETARFRDTSQQIHKQWQADPTRAFPSVGNATINSSHVLTSDVSSPNSTPSPSSSPINEHQITTRWSCSKFTGILVAIAAVILPSFCRAFLSLCQSIK
ncbi:hypothetical protein PV326_007925 [Microctonus aethiopoides]|nr:hypothetical protein PV326_007925 [Microctonus aethiopoides]